MPVTIGTIDGKADYVIVNAIKQLKTAVETLEQQAATLQRTAISLQADIRRLDVELGNLTRLVQQNQQAITALQNP